jgi:hypothetical protein
MTTIYNYMSNKKNENFGHKVGDAMSDGDFGTWCDQWDKALADGLFDDAPKPNSNGPFDHGQQSSSPDLSDYDAESLPDHASQRTPVDGVLNEVDVNYWKSVYKLSSNQGDAPDVVNELSSKEAKTPNAKELSKRAKVVANEPNPVRINTVGKDQDSRSDSTTSEAFQKLTELKKELHSIGNKLAEMKDSNLDAIYSKFEKIQSKIDELSDSLSPNYVSDSES